MFTLEVTLCRVFVADVGFELMVLAKALPADLAQIWAYPKVHLVDVLLMRPEK